MDELAVVSLSNARNDEGKPIIEWIQPCPTVGWAGELNRDKGFLINLLSDVQDKISVTVNNPDFNNGSFFKKREVGRLEHVFLKYRKMGSNNPKKYIQGGGGMEIIL